MWQDTSEGDCGADQGVELLVTTDGKLQVAGGDTLDLEVLGGVLQNRDCVSINSTVAESQAAPEQAPRWNAEREGGDSGMTHACELEDFGSQVLEDSGNVDGSLGANTHLVLGVRLEETLDTTAGELEAMEVSNQIIGRDSGWSDVSRHVKPRVEIDAVHAIRRKAMLMRDAMPSSLVLCLKSRTELGTVRWGHRWVQRAHTSRACR